MIDLPSAFHVTVTGAGQPVVPFHSGGMSSRQWRRLEVMLAATHRVIAPDFLGSGESAPWPHDVPFHFERDVEVALALVRAEAEPVHLVGHSYGGLVALAVAREAPANVRSIAVYDPVAFGVLHAANDAAGLADLAQAEAHPTFTDDALGGSAAWYELFVDYWNGRGSWSALPKPTQDAFLKVGRKVYGEVSSLMRDRTPASAYAAITAPALLLGGERSPPAARGVVRLLGEAMPNARVRTIEGAGHMGPISHGAIVCTAIAEHIAAAR
jgi:pimeloyl-ACP methyl ester carboxylesterase